MNLVYAQNSDLYFDNATKKIVFAKRGQFLTLDREKKEIETIKSIINQFEEPKPVEQVLADIPEGQKNTFLSYIKFLWKNNILVEFEPKIRNLHPDFYHFLISNFGGKKELTEFWETVQICCMGCTAIADELKKYGLNCQIVDNIDAILPGSLAIGDFDSEECRILLNRECRTVLLRFKNSNAIMLFLQEFNEEALHRYEKYEWGGTSVFFAQDVVVAFNILLLCSTGIFDPRQVNIVCVSSDGTINSFPVMKLTESSTGYFNRAIVPMVNDRVFLEEIEKLDGKAPYLFETANEHNNEDCQSPICNYEMNFGIDFHNTSFKAYHQNYAAAAELAFLDGLEAVLNQSGNRRWRCERDLIEYRIKGYISLLNGIETVCYPLLLDNSEIKSRIAYWEEMTGEKLKVYFVPSEVEGIGKVLLCDSKQQILQESGLDYRVERQVLNLLYKDMGQRQNGMGSGEGASCMEEHFQMKEEPMQITPMTKEEAQNRLMKYFSDRGSIIDERIWAYQMLIMQTGVHVGEFYFVK